MIYFPLLSDSSYAISLRTILGILSILSSRVEGTHGVKDRVSFQDVHYWSIDIYCYPAFLIQRSNIEQCCWEKKEHISIRENQPLLIQACSEGLVRT